MREVVVIDQKSYDRSEILCPTSGEVCPARMLLVENYRPDKTEAGDPEYLAIKAQAEFERGGISDEAILGIKLKENEFWAEKTHCEGPDIHRCPTRTLQNESMLRRMGVRAIRAIRGTWQ